MIKIDFRIGYGALPLTGQDAWGPPSDREGAIKVLRRAVDLGVALIDTADSYGLGANEELIAEALHPYPDGLLIATKTGRTRPSPGEWGVLGRPDYVKQQAELSRRRLRVDRIDLFQLHRVDPSVPFEDQIGCLRELRDAGVINHIGLSEVDVEQLERARSIVEIASVQNRYNYLDRRHDNVIDYCERHGIAFLPWRPIDETFRDYRIKQAAKDLSATPAQVALAWLLQRSPVVTPIPGTSSVEHLVENCAAALLEPPLLD
ncbi:aldo/keto reductase [Allorhizocola rhizosphaerae]|uniref:aldo/keto reductase n=1 Tax=Allorhizocola rhizosphaerae TaxID=1872709 RepID=UPI001FE5AE90|nr:aldo/keto reductase [Allorhizocola rhizosphaerae]